MRAISPAERQLGSANYRLHKGGSCYDESVIKVLEEAIAKIKRLPEDRQAYAAKVLEQIAAAYDGVFEIPDDHIAAVLEGLQQAERGKFASDADVEAMLGKRWR